MRNTLTVDGVDLSTYGIYISGHGVFKSPAKEIVQFDVPGHDGTVIGKSSRLLNLDVTYPAFIYSNFRTNLRSLRSFLLSREGYVKISDSYNSDEFRLGMFVNEIAPDVTLKNDAGKFDLVFNCKPQRYLTSGETQTTVTASTTFTNPSPFIAKPIIRVHKPYGGGTITFTDPNTGWRRVIKIDSGISSSILNIDIDCETQQTYYPGSGYINYNKYVSFYRAANGSLVEFYDIDAPGFLPGTNTITFSGTNIDYIIVTPRWWMT